MACIDVDPAAGSIVADSLPGGRASGHVARGNGCPSFRDYDVHSVTGFGSPIPDEQYEGPVKGTVSYASIVRPAGSGADHRVVVDGVSLHERRDADCLGTGAIEERIREVLSFFETCPENLCPPPGVGDAPSPGEPYVTALLGVSPNPLSPGRSGKIRFSLEREGTVEIAVLDVTGRRVRTLVREPRPAGMHEVPWDWTGSGGEAVANGVYFYRLEAGGKKLAKKLVVLGGK